MKMARWKVALGIIFIAFVSAPAWSANTDNRSAVPGTLNYVEGQTFIGDQAVNSQTIGSTQLGIDQVLMTQNGKAEVLLTPGVLLRVGSNSSVKMVSPDLTNTQVAVDRGEAMLEVDEIHSQNDIRVSQPGANTKILKTGLYNFDAGTQQIRVFDGKADVQAGDREVTVKGGHELTLNPSGKLKAQGFDKKAVSKNDDLYRWSSLRSEYLSEANVESARGYLVNGSYGPGWIGPGWYWNPFFRGFTFVPSDGFFYSPFGWGFYSPLVIHRVPVVVGRVPHHFDGHRPGPMIGSGFHHHAVRTFPNTGHVRGVPGVTARPHKG